MLDIDKSNNTKTEILTVTAFTDKVKTLFNRFLDDFVICGEISNFKPHSSGHWYFSLKDENASVSCICFKNVNNSIKFKLEDGMQVVIKGSVDVYAPRGSYSIKAISIEPVGKGALQLAFEQLRNEFQELGLLDISRKKAIPLFPKKIGIVTSITSAALQDMLTALARRNKSVNIVIAPSKVQGDGAEDEIAQAIEDLNTLSDIEVILVARGGGSIEDLWAFNTRVVALAVINSRIPIISGVGHETDITICDLVADLRAPTPTAAAELVAANFNQLVDKAKFLNKQLIDIMQHKIISLQNKLKSYQPSSILSNIISRLNLEKSRLALLNNKIDNSINNKINSSLQKFKVLENKFNDLNPISIIRRGYSIVYNLDDKIVSNISDVTTGQNLKINFENGVVLVEVKEIKKQLIVE